MNGRRIFTVEVDLNSPQSKKYHTMYVLEDTGGSGGGSGPSPVAGDVTWGDIKGDIGITTALLIEDATKDITATLSNKTVDAKYNTINNLATLNFSSSALALSSNNVRTYDNSVDTKVVTEKFLQKTLHNIELPEENKDAANKKYVDDLITELNGKILKFKGFVSTTAPTGSIKNSSLWYESNSLPSAFPINVKTYNATTNQWSSTTSQYTPESLDLWANLNDDKGYYWFGNGWNMIDDNGRFLYVSTFTGVIGNPSVLYYLDTAYSTYEKGFYRFIPASGGNQEKFVLLNKELFKYVSTFTGVTGNVDRLYFLDTEYDSYKVGFYRFIEAQGSEPAKFIHINPSPIKYVSTFNGVVGNIEDLYYLDTEYDNYELGFYRFVEATTTEPLKFVLLNKQRFKYVSTFTGEIGDINRLYYLDTTYDNFKKGFYRYNGTTFVNINPKQFFYVSTFTGVEGDDESLYYLDTAYDTYKVGFYRFIPAVGAEPAKFVLIGRPLVKYVSTFNGEEGDTDVLYYLDTKYDDYKVGFYRYIEAQGTTPAKFLLIGSTSEVFTDVGVNESLPTTDINDMTIYRKANYIYKHNGVVLENVPNGYKILDTTDISVSNTGITIDSVETLWNNLSTATVEDLLSNDRIASSTYDEAEFFNYNSTLFDISTKFEKVDEYTLYYNPTKTVGKYILIGVDGNSISYGTEFPTNPQENDFHYLTLLQTISGEIFVVGLYRYNGSDWVLVSDNNDFIDVNDNLPTTDIRNDKIYRLKVYAYLHNDIELESEPVGYKIVDTENISVSATGITIDGIETLWEDLTDTIVSGLVTAERLTDADFIEADFFNYNTALFDIASNFEREPVYTLYYNPTATAGKYIQIGGGSVIIDNKTIVENLSNELQANAIIEVDALPTSVGDIKKNTLYKTDIRELKDKDGFYINPSDTYIADGTHVQVLTNGLQDVGNDTLYEWTNVDNALITLFVNSSYLTLTDDYGDEQEVICIGKLEENVYSYCKAVLNNVLYTYSNNSWKLVADYKDIKNCDEYTISTNVYNKLESKAIIDVNALPTSGIYPTIIYRILEDVYLYDGEEIEIPQGYRGTSENITVTNSGITFNSTEYPFATLTDTQFDEITDKETCSFDDAEWFKISSNKYDYNTTVTKELVYKLYHNPTGQANEYIKIGGEGGSADVEIDNTTITNVNDKLQANAILEVSTLPTTNIKEKSVYKIVDKVPEYIDKYYYNGSTTPMNQTPNMYKGDGEHITFTTTGATINGNSVAYSAITATQIATYEAQGWVLNVDYDEAEALHVSGDTFDSITKLDKQVETVYHDMVKYYYREDGNWVNHSVVNLTQDLYDNLSTEQKTDGTIYVVDDATPVIQRFTYDELSNKPSINGITLQNSLNLEDLSLYSRSLVNALLEGKGQVEFVNALPATPTTNTWYYSKKYEDGTDVPDDKRVLYIVDEDTTVYNDMGIVGDIEMETGDTLTGSEHLVTSSQVVQKELSTKLNKYGTQVNVETAVNDATLWTMLALIGTDDKKTDSSMVFNAGTCYLISSVSPTKTAQIFQFIVTGSVGASAINKRITLINPLTNEMFTKVMDGGTWQAWKGGKKYKHTLVRYNNDSFEYTMGWTSVISNKKTMSVDDFKTWLNEKGYTTATNSYYWCGGCCGTTEVRNGAGTGKAYVGRVASGVFYDGTNMFFKWDYNGTTQINPARCKVITEELN